MTSSPMYYLHVILIKHFANHCKTGIRFPWALLFPHSSQFNKISIYFHIQQNKAYSLNKQEWICSLFKEWILEKSEIRVNLEWTFVLFTHFGVTSGITRNPWVIPVVTPKWVNNTNVHSKFTPNSINNKHDNEIFIEYNTQSNSMYMQWCYHILY